MKAPIVAGNWKMHMTPDEGRSFVEEMQNLILDVEGVTVIFCPPFTSLFNINTFLKSGFSGNTRLGAQNCHWEPQGAYTGEISLPMLKNCGVDYVIVGHSERRHVFNETDSWVRKKVQAVLETGLIPILCLGETLEEREAGETESVLKRQLTEGMREVDTPERILIAYEPVWAIGTGLTATTGQVSDAHAYLRGEFEQLYAEFDSESLPILYGGSVNAGNARELIETKGVDGFLIGGASLKVDSFHAIIKMVERTYSRK